METATFSLAELFQMGGVVMYPLLVFSIAVVAISIERIVYFASNNLRVDDLRKKTQEFIKIGDYEGAKTYLLSLKDKRMGARIFLSLVKQAKAGEIFSEHRAEKAVETEASDCITSLESGFNFLIALGSLAPLTGFLGTVTGMIGAFQSIATATDVNAQIVAGGIYEALITTVFGLVVAIIAMVAHSVFSHIVERFTTRVESSSSRLIAHMIEQAGDSAKLICTHAG